MSQISEMGTKRGVKKPSRKPPPSEQGLAPSAGPDVDPAHSGPVVVDLESSPLSHKRKAEIPPEDLEHLAHEGIRVTRTALARSLLFGDNETGNESGAPPGVRPVTIVSPSPPVQSFGIIRSIPDQSAQPSPTSQAHSEAGQPYGSEPRSS